MITQQKINLNLVPGGVLPIVNVSQFDVQTNGVEFTLYAGDTLFTLPNGAGVTVNGKKPDSTGFTYSASYASGSIVRINITKQMCAVAGDAMCELRISVGSQDIGSANFILRVERSPMDDAVISETVLPLIEQAAEIAATIGEYAETVAQEAIAATNSASAAASSAAQAQTAAANVEQQYSSLETLKTQTNAAAAAANAAAASLSSMSAEANTLAAGSSATATYNNSTKKFTFGIPKGDKGDSGVYTQISGWFAMGVETGTAHDGELYVDFEGSELSASNFDYQTSGDLYFLIDEGA